MVRALGGVGVVVLCAAACPAPSASPPDAGAAPVDAGVTGPDLTSCLCADGTALSDCTGDVECQQAESVTCDNACAAHGGFREQRCRLADFGCALAGAGIASGGDEVVCSCGQQRSAQCTALACGDARIDAACASSCPDAGPSTTCAASSSCAASGAPSGTDLVQCVCVDGSKPSTCADDACNGGFDFVCAGLCADHRGFANTGAGACQHDALACGVAPASGANAVVCTCSNGGALSSCTGLDCGTDQATIASACDVACGASSTASCAADSSCAAGGPPLGPDLSQCFCGDGTVVDVCEVGTSDCEAPCADHRGFNLATFFEPDVGCLLGGRGNSAVSCPCSATFGIDRCSDIACGDVDSAAKIDDACAQECGVSGVTGTCTSDDPGCAAGFPPSGQAFAQCRCTDGALVADRCLVSCNDADLDNQTCVPACHDHGGVAGGGTGERTCAIDTTKCP